MMPRPVHGANFLDKNLDLFFSLFNIEVCHNRNQALAPRSLLKSLPAAEHGHSVPAIYGQELEQIPSGPWMLPLVTVTQALTPLQVLGDPGLYTPYDQALHDLMALCPAVW